MPIEKITINGTLYIVTLTLNDKQYGEIVILSAEGYENTEELFASSKDGKYYLLDDKVQAELSKKYLTPPEMYNINF